MSGQTSREKSKRHGGKNARRRPWPFITNDAKWKIKQKTANQRFTRLQKTRHDDDDGFNGENHEILPCLIRNETTSFPAGIRKNNSSLSDKRSPIKRRLLSSWPIIFVVKRKDRSTGEECDIAFGSSIPYLIRVIWVNQLDHAHIVNILTSNINPNISICATIVNYSYIKTVRFDLHGKKVVESKCREILQYSLSLSLSPLLSVSLD